MKMQQIYIDKKYLLILTIILFLVVVVLLLSDNSFITPNEAAILLFENGRTEEIDCWKNQDDEYYVFLPSYANLSQVQIHLDTENTVSIDGIQITDGMYCDDLQLDKPCELSYTLFGKTYQSTITFLQSGNVATMHIDTESGSMDYIHEKKGNEEAGTIRLYRDDGGLDYSGAIESINGRGNNTWLDFDKKPYSLKLSSEADLLGMGCAQKWILLANADDPSNLRNKIAYEFAATVGLKYSPDSQWVDLYLNGEYAGLYLLCERNEVHLERVNIAENNSFLISWERDDRLIEQNYKHITTESGLSMRVHHTSATSDESLMSLLDTWQSVENAVLSDDGIDGATGKTWQELIDLDSWVKKYLIEELFGNLDGFMISQYFYKYGNDSDAKVCAGPVWDFDKAMGNDNDPRWSISNPEVFVVGRYGADYNAGVLWANSLYQKDEFHSRLIELFKTDFLPNLEVLLNEQMQDYINQVEVASNMNFIRWYDKSEHKTLDEEFYEISTYLEKHATFLKSTWIDKVEYCQVSVTNLENDAFYSVRPGECLDELPKIEDTDTSVFCGLYYTDTDEPFDITKPIYEDTEIYAKWEDKPSKTLNRIVKLIPIGVIAVMFVCLFVVEIKRMRKNRVTKDA